ncbi:hypothetical protein GCM10027262_15560 [Nocardia tengchongensis]
MWHARLRSQCRRRFHGLAAVLRGAGSVELRVPGEPGELVATGRRNRLRHAGNRCGLGVLVLTGVRWVLFAASGDGTVAGGIVRC